MSRKRLILALCLGVLPVVFIGCWGSNDSNQDPFVYPFRAVVVDPASSSRVYAVSEGGGFFRTADGGKTWVQPISGLAPDVRVEALAVDPNVTPTNDPAPTCPTIPTSTMLYLGDENTGLYRSLNEGTNWALQGLSPNITDIVVDRTTSKCTPRDQACTDIYASSQTSGIVRSQDRGLTWDNFNANLASQSVSALTIFNGANPATLYAGTEEGFVFRRRLDQPTWTPADAPQPIDPSIGETEIIALTVDPSNAAILYAGLSGGEGGRRPGSGLYQSADAGVSWTNVQRPDRVFTDSVHVVQFVLATAPGAGCDTNTIKKEFLFTNINRVSFQEYPGGVWQSPALDDDNFSNVGVTAIAVSEFYGAADPKPDDPKVIYAGTYNKGLWKSCDGGHHWTVMNLAGDVNNLPC